MAGGASKFTPERIKLILELAEDGIPIVAICEGVGISEECLRTWRREGEKEGADPDKAKFAEDFCAARLRGMHALVKAVRKKALDPTDADWKAAMTLMERIWPQFFARRDPDREEVLTRMNELNVQLLAALTGSQPIPATIRAAIAAKDGAGDDGDGVDDGGGVEG